jgi:hypothetical protein
MRGTGHKGGVFNRQSLRAGLEDGTDPEAFLICRGCAMSSAQQCRAQAELCRKLARTVSEVWVAVTLDEMAAEYMSRAEKLETAEHDEMPAEHSEALPVRHDGSAE